MLLTIFSNHICCRSAATVVRNTLTQSFHVTRKQYVQPTTLYLSMSVECTRLECGDARRAACSPVWAPSAHWTMHAIVSPSNGASCSVLANQCGHILQRLLMQLGNNSTMSWHSNWAYFCTAIVTISCRVYSAECTLSPPTADLHTIVPL